MNVSEAFGHVRALIEEGPGERRFQQVLAALEGVDEGAVEEQVLPYCEDRMRGWAPSTRSLAYDDAVAWASGAWSPRWRLARRVDWVCTSPQDKRLLKVPARARAFVEALERHGGITHLDLCGAQLGVEGARLLASSPALEKLEHLDLRYNLLGDDGVEALAGSGRLGQLQTLMLRRNKIKTKGVKALAGASAGPLMRLGLGYNRSGARAGTALVRSGMLGGARYVDLGYNYLGAENVRELLGSGQLADVEYLNVRQNGVSDAFVMQLIEVGLPRLRHLSVWNNTISNAAREAMCEADVFGSLETLGGIDTWGTSWRERMIASGRFPRLTLEEHVWGEVGAGAGLEVCEGHEP